MVYGPITFAAPILQQQASSARTTSSSLPLPRERLVKWQQSPLPPMALALRTCRTRLVSVVLDVVDFFFLLSAIETQNRREERCTLHRDGRRYESCTREARRHAFLLVPIAGESGLGKTTPINTLFATELHASKNYSRRHQKQLDKLTEVEIIKAELEEKQFKVKLTVIDTPGFGDYVNNRDSWVPIIDFVDDQHEIYMRQEQQPQRAEKSDLRVHACLYFIRPTGHTYACPAVLFP